MPNADAQFIFETNLPEVRQQIQSELGRISSAVSESQGAQGGDFVGGLTKGLTGDVSRAIAEIRRIRAEADEAVSGSATRAAGTPAVSVQFNDVITGLTRQIEDRVRKAALKAGADMGQLDLSAIMRQVDEAFTKKARDEARALVRTVERSGTPQAQAVYGSTKDIPTGIPRTTLTTPAELQQQAADEKQARKESAASARRLARSTEANARANDEQAADTQQETSQRRSRRRRVAQSEDALAAANEQAAATTKQTSNTRVTKINLSAGQQEETARILGGLKAGDPNFGYATRTGESGTGARSVPIVDRTDPANLRFFSEAKGGTAYEEIAKETPKYARLLAQENARLERQQQEEAQAEAERLAAIRATTQRLLAQMAAQDPSVGYVTKRGTQGKYAFEGTDPDTAKIYQNTGSKDEPQFEELARGSKEFNQAQARLVPILEQLRPVIEQRIQALRQAAELDLQLAAEQAILKVALSRRIRASLLNGDGEFQFLSRNNTPTQQVYSTRTNDVFRENAEGGYDEITAADRDYVRAQNKLADVVGHRAATDLAEDEQVTAAKRAYVESLEVKAKLAANDPSAQYLTDSGRPTTRVAVGRDGSIPDDPATARYFQRKGDNFTELLPGEQAYTDAQRLHVAQLRDATTATDRAREASQRYTDSLRKSAAASLGRDGSGGFGGGLNKGLFSGGFGDNGDSPAFGLGRAVGQTVKYSALYKILNDLLMISGQVAQEFLNVDDSITELQVAMVGTNEVSGDFISRLQDIAAPGGFNVGDAMDQAAAGVRAYRDEITKANDATGDFQRDIGVHLADAAAKIAVIGNTTLPDAAQNTRATMLGFGLDPLTGGNQVADAVAGAKLIGGGLPKDISQGGANIAEVAHAAGFSLQEALSIVSKISADTDESGTLAATRFSRMIGTLQGSSGKNYLTQLNQSLPDDKKIDVNASPRDQLLQVAAAYDLLSKAQKGQTATAIAGQAQQKEFNVLVQAFPSIAKQAAQSQTGLADKEYQERLDNVRNLLGQIRGELRGIITNLATSGALAAFGLMLKGLIPILDAVRLISGEFNRIPGIVRNIGGALVAVVGTLKAVDFIKNAGGGSITAGIKGVFNNAESVVRPQAAAARRELTGGDPFQRVVVEPAVARRDATYAAIAQKVDTGDLTLGAATTARKQAEQDYRAEIRASTVDYRKAAKDGAYAVADGGKQVAAETTRNAGVLRKWGTALNPTETATALKAGRANVQEAIAEFAAAIRGGAGQVGVAAAEGEAEAALGGAAGAATRGGKVGGFLGRSVRNVGSGLGTLLSPSILGPIVGFAAIDAASKLADTSGSIDDAQRTIDKTRALDVPAGADSLQQAAAANAEAAKAMRDASGGFFGAIINAQQGGAAGHAATDSQALSDQQTALANRLKDQQAQASTLTGTAALASQINVAEPDKVQSSVQALLDAGQTASSVLDALALSLKNLKFAATGAVSDLSDLQKTDLAGRAGISAGEVFGQSRDAIQQQIDNSSVGGFRHGLGDQQQTDRLQGQLNSLNKVGQQGITDTASGVISDFFKNNPGATLDNPAVIDGIKRDVFNALTQRGLDKGTAALAGTRATATLAQDREKFLADIATPQGAGALVDSTLTVGQLEQQRIQGNAQLKAIRTGTPDRSATAGLKAYQDRLRTAQDTIWADIQALDIKDPTGKSSAALRLQIIKVQAALADNQVKMLQQSAADAKSDIDEMEKHRRAQQAAATSAAQVAAIGDKFIGQELDKAIKTMDPDLIAQVMAMASKRELDNYQRQLDANLASDQAAVEAEQKREIALGLLNPDGSPIAMGSRPSPLMPGAKGPLNVPDLLTGGDGSKAQIPKPLQDLLDQVGADKNQRALFAKLYGEVTPTGTAETGADAPGGTPEERAGSADAAKAEKDRNSTEAAAAKVRLAKAAMDKITDHGSKDYHAAQEAYYAALNAQADLAQDTAIAQTKAGLYPGDKVGAAKLALDEATNAVGRFAKGSKEYWDAIGRQVQSQVDYANAQREQANLIAQTHIDLTDPVQVANQALADARRKKRDDIAHHHADKGTLAQDDIDIANKGSGVDQAAFQQRLSDAQTAEQLGRISHAAYLRFLEGEHNRLTDRLKGMKKTDQGYRQAVDQLNEIDKDIKGANQQLSGQFNLGDIKVPTVYEVRRSLKAATGTDTTQVANSAQVTNNNQQVTVNGADFGRVMEEIYKIFGKTIRHSTQKRKA